MADTALRDRLQGDIKDALRARDKNRVGVLRFVTAAIKQREVDERVTLGDADVLAVLDKLARQRRDAIEQYEQADRQDLADQERSELAILQEYLPTPLSDAEIETLITDAIAQTGAASIRDMGKVMNVLRPALQGRADMAQVSAQVKGRLT